jgi:D-ala D-ala ligase C-terminus
MKSEMEDSNGMKKFNKDSMGIVVIFCLVNVLTIVDGKLGREANCGKIGSYGCLSKLVCTGREIFVTNGKLWGSGVITPSKCFLQVKPTRAGSSIGVEIAYGVDDAIQKAASIISRRIDERVLIELFLEGGKEFTSIVLDVGTAADSQPIVLLPTEVGSSFRETFFTFCFSCFCFSFVYIH